ncbi:hypothetical protein [Roseivirga sp.]|uniref:hypothetical protein n=1 Tax=Roseivirga sp. TaxID=1964215 RepID=UPI003B529D29
MNIINPNEIGAKISTLIAEAETSFCAVSPYISLTDWKKIKVNLVKAIERGVIVEFYYREIKTGDKHFLETLNISHSQIDGLHTKLYYNEKEFIVSSMNLYEFSDLHSIDIALHYTEKKDYKALLDYVNRYIKKGHQNSASSGYKDDGHVKSLYTLHQFLKTELSGVKIGSSLGYLYAKSVATQVDLFIRKESIGIKMVKPDPDKESIEAFYAHFNQLLPYTLEKEYPNGGYRYMILTITLENNSGQEIVDIVNMIRKA